MVPAEYGLQLLSFFFAFQSNGNDPFDSSTNKNLFKEDTQSDVPPALPPKTGTPTRPPPPPPGKMVLVLSNDALTLSFLMAYSSWQFLLTHFLITISLFYFKILITLYYFKNIKCKILNFTSKYHLNMSYNRNRPNTKVISACQVYVSSVMSDWL